MNYKNEVQLVFNDKLCLRMYELLNMPSILAILAGFEHRERKNSLKKSNIIRSNLKQDFCN